MLRCGGMELREILAVRATPWISTYYFFQSFPFVVESSKRTSQYKSKEWKSSLTNFIMTTFRRPETRQENNTHDVAEIRCAAYRT